MNAKEALTQFRDWCEQQRDEAALDAEEFEGVAAQSAAETLDVVIEELDRRIMLLP